MAASVEESGRPRGRALPDRAERTLPGDGTRNAVAPDETVNSRVRLDVPLDVTCHLYVPAGKTSVQFTQFLAVVIDFVVPPGYVIVS